MKHLENKLQELLNELRSGKKRTNVSINKVREIKALVKRALESGNEHIRKIALAVMVLIATNVSYGQYFTTPVANPYGMSVADNFTQPVLVDIDGDGDLDLFSSGYYGSVYYQENTGTANSPIFATAVTFPFGIAQSYSQITTMTFGDIDNDGDYDLITNGDYYNGDALLYFENTGNATAPAFAAPAMNPFGITSMGGDVNLSWPQLVNLDNDGDLDLMVGVYDSYYAKQFVYFENTGIVGSPSFAAPVNDPYGLQGQLPLLATPTFVDIDGDGDYDLFSGGTYDTNYKGQVLYFENTGTAALPAFAAPQTNAFGIIDWAKYFAFPTFGDLDNDGDFDLLVGEYDGYYGANFFYLENILVSSVDNIAETSRIKLYPQPSSDFTIIESGDNISLIKLLDGTGKLLNTFSVNANKYRLSVGEYPAGVYYVDVFTTEEKRTLKLIKN